MAMGHPLWPPSYQANWCILQSIKKHTSVIFLSTLQKYNVGKVINFIEAKVLSTDVWIILKVKATRRKVT